MWDIIRLLKRMTPEILIPDLRSEQIMVELDECLVDILIVFLCHIELLAANREDIDFFIRETVMRNDRILDRMLETSIGRIWPVLEDCVSPCGKFFIRLVRVTFQARKKRELIKRIPDLLSRNLNFIFVCIVIDRVCDDKRIQDILWQNLLMK